MRVFLAIFAVLGMVSSDVQACGGPNRGAIVISNGGFNSFVPQSIVVPQSTAFFSGGNVAFINQPQVFGHNRAFINVNPVAQQINIRRGAQGNVRRVQIQNVAQPALNINVGRSRVFIR